MSENDQNPWLPDREKDQFQSGDTAGIGVGAINNPWRSLKDDPPLHFGSGARDYECVVLYPQKVERGIPYTASNLDYARVSALRAGYTHWMPLSSPMAQLDGDRTAAQQAERPIETLSPPAQPSEGVRPRYMVEGNCIVNDTTRQTVAKFTLWNGTVDELRAALSSPAQNNWQADPLRVIHDSLQEWNSDEFTELDWCNKAAARAVEDLKRAGCQFTDIAEASRKPPKGWRYEYDKPRRTIIMVADKSATPSHWQADPRTVEACAKIVDEQSSTYEGQSGEYHLGFTEAAWAISGLIRALAPSLPAAAEKKS